jgi:hypothetical protein
LAAIQVLEIRDWPPLFCPSGMHHNVLPGPT